MEKWFAWLAAVLTTVSFVPQAVKVLKERHTRDISLAMYTLFTIGVALWFVFGLMIHSPPIWLANGITMMLASVVLTMKIRCG